MHAYFLTRGIKQDVDLFVKFLETRTLRMPFKDKDGKDGVIPIQGALRPIQLWEYVFPENEKDVVLSTLRFDEPIVPDTLKMKAGVKSLRMALGAKKIPDFKKTSKMFMPDNLWVSIVPIGVKYDKLNHTFKANGLTHEFL